MPNIHRSALHNDIITTPKILNLNVTTAKIADAAVTAVKLAPSALTAVNVAPAALTGIGVGVDATFDIPNTAGDYDLALPFKVEFFQMVVIKTGSNGGAGDTVTLNTATAISNAVSLNAVVGAIANASAMDPTQNTVAAAGTLRVSAAKVTNCAARILVHGVVRA